MTVETGRGYQHRLPRTPSAIVLLAGSAVVVANAAGLFGAVEASMFVALSAVAVVATVTGLRWYRPALRWPWWFISAALVLFLFGGAARQHVHSLGDLSPGRSLLPDLISIPGYLILGGALFGLARARRRGRAGDIDALLDAAIAALAVLTLAWTFLISPVVQRTLTPLPVKAVIATYPALSVFLVALSIWIAFSPASRRVVAYRLLLAAMAMMLLGDVVYMFLETGLLHLPIQLADAPYALAYVFCAGCTLHPSMRLLSDPIAPDEVAPRNGRLAFVAFAIGVPALLTVTRRSSTLGDNLVIASIALALTATASLRVLRALRAHARSEANLAYQATHDPLTRLPNRLAAGHHIEQVAHDALSRGGQVALMFLDLDRFKLLNDTMGHTAGDELLIAVAERLVRCVGDDAFVARVGGDEFLVVLSDFDDPSDAIDTCERVRTAIEAPFRIRGGDVFTSASIGVTFATGSALVVNAEAMVREADTAMYQAKDAGRNGISVFDASMRDRVTERLTLERDLHLALERDQLDIHFQPIVGLPAGPVEGVEALLRWSHPTRGLIPPDKFIPVAEDSSLIVEIGEWVLMESCHRLSELREKEDLPADLYVSVNLSARQLRDPHLLDTVRRVLTQTGIPPSSLCLELTESLLMEEPAAAATLLAALRDLGIRILIDDFGTGYSSLAYAQRFPAQCVKIDRSFVEALGSKDSSHESLVAAIVAMAAALDMKTIAEGVETPAQEARLIQLGCHSAQGYFYSRPVPADQIPAVLRRLTVPESALPG